MGFTIVDNINVLDLEVKLSNLHATLRSNFNVEKRINYADIKQTTVSSVQYFVMSQLFIKPSAESRSILTIRPISIEITKEQWTGDLLSMLYAEAKSMYTETIDDTVV